MQLRHGDIFLVRVDRLPVGVRQVPRTEDSIVLAYGEATGHAHRLTGDVLEYVHEGTGRRYVSASSPAPLRHEEHGFLPVLPAVYEVRQQRTYQYGEERRVVD